MKPESDATPESLAQLAGELERSREQLRGLTVRDAKTVNAYKAFRDTTRQSYIVMLEYLKAGQNTEAIAYLTKSLAEWVQDEDEPARH